MWPLTFEERLAEWHELRSRLDINQPEQCMQTINDWWFRAPMVNHHLHWDDCPNWPGPWDLLADNHFCDLARALGMLYTVMMIDTKHTLLASLGQTDNDNLVLVDQGKYILNWAPRQLLNIHSNNISILRQVDGEALRQHLG